MWGGTPFSSITALSLRNRPFLTQPPFPYATALPLRNCPFLKATLPFLSSRAKPRDLRFCGPFLEMFFERVHPIFRIATKCNSSSVPQPQGRRVPPTNTRYKVSRSYPAPVLFPIVVRGRDKCSP
jgi:hypothetical protein